MFSSDGVIGGMGTKETESQFVQDTSIYFSKDMISDQSNSSIVSNTRNMSSEFARHDSTKSIDSSSEMTSTRKLANQENNKIFNLKAILICLLFGGAALAAYFMYTVSREGEKEQFVSHFQDNAIKILDTFEARLRRSIAAIDTYAVVSSTAVTDGDKWPFVVAPRFEIHGASSRNLAGSGMLAVLPLVTQDMKTEWQDFTLNNTQWIVDGLSFEESFYFANGGTAEGLGLDESKGGTWQDFDGLNMHSEHGHGGNRVNISDGIADQIFEISPMSHSAIEDSSEGPYFPVWQTTPVQKHLVNYNLLTHGSFGKDMRQAISEVKIVFGRIADVSVIHDPFHFIFRAAERQPDKINVGTGNEESSHMHTDGNMSHTTENHNMQMGVENAMATDKGQMGMGGNVDMEGGIDKKHGHALRSLGVDHDVSDDEHVHRENPSDDNGNDDTFLGMIGEGEYIEGHGGGDYGSPTSMTFFPIFNRVDEPRNMVGLLAAVLYWQDFMVGALAPQAKPIIAVLSNKCDQVFSFQIEGGNVYSLGEGDFHNSFYNNMAIQFGIKDIAAKSTSTSTSKSKSSLTFSGVELAADYCAYDLTVYPTPEMEDAFLTSKPIIYAACLVSAFFFAALVFFLYDILVAVRQRKVARRAEATSAVVNSLFPANVRERLFHHDTSIRAEDAKLSVVSSPFLSPHFGSQRSHQSLPIADLFPHATVLFADIASFTAWASSREPTQVFMLLETLYGKFDGIAKKWKVFKVETIGDCYVAATGVPEYQEDHAVRMVKFALVCLERVNALVRELESSLGPDTGSLLMRFGIHSGPVTAGVLRGEKSRFQLFGDTMNMASRMESTGIPGRLQCSETTAILLKEAGKGSLLHERTDCVHAKGKGKVKTFWVFLTQKYETESTSVSSIPGSSCSSSHSRSLGFRSAHRSLGNDSLQRLIDWNVDMLHHQLRNLVASRGQSTMKEKPSFVGAGTRESNPISEVKEVICMSRGVTVGLVKEPVEIPPDALSQLRDYVTIIAGMYRDSNPFHNFAHSSHVSLSAQKLLSRIVAVQNTDGLGNERPPFPMAGSNSSFAYGIAADPLTHFAILFSTMIHDVDHSGVSNHQLIKEGASVALHYENKSIAEQNSIDIAWDLLMENSYDALRACIFDNQEEHDRFRSLVVNSVIATDIFDKDLKAFRKDRWEKAFSSPCPEEVCLSQNDLLPTDLEDASADLKATIIIEHLIQASDVAHTMQHWHIYQKWNQKLFFEMSKAYQEGRMEKDPALGWYEGELWFFDNYVIPLAKNLFDCDVFGVSSDEYLQYATENRGEWESKGKEIVQAWVDEAQSNETFG